MKLFVLFLFLLVNFINFSQTIKIDGVVSGYNYNPSKGVFKKKSDILLEGRLPKVKIQVLKENKVIKSTSSNKDGRFNLKIPVGYWYSVVVTKNNYEKIMFDLDLTSAEHNLTLNTLELILNKNVPEKIKSVPSFGILGYNSNGFYFKETKIKSKKISKYIDYTPLISLVKESIQKNKNNNSSSNHLGINSQNQTNDNNTTEFSNDSLSIIKNSNIYSKLIERKEANEANIKQKEQTILDAKKQLEIDKKNAKTDLDFLLIKEREKLIESAENEVKHLKDIIKQKEKLIKLKNTQIWLFVGLFSLAVILVLFILKSNSEKSKLNKTLKENHKKIDDSIDYAEKIQSAILPAIDGLNQILPNSFILFKPKDVVSGDFYWFDKIKDKIIIAAIDCTGHGIPGALMSMMGNAILNNIILEKQIISPKEILNQLNEQLKQALNQNENDPFSSLDGMDMSLCVIDTKNKLLTYAGAMNPIYVVNNGEIETLEVTKRGIGGFDLYKAGDFKEFTKKIDVDDKFYMLTDGFQDQFGGEAKEKFNLKRFKDLVLRLESQPLTNQKNNFNKALTEWKKDNDQTDDILIIGFSL